MGKKASRKIGNNFIQKNKKLNNTQNEGKKQELENKLLELSDDDIEKLFEAGKIDQSEYEYILSFRKKQRNKKKSQKEKFEERIRCNDNIIQKVINLGRKFRVQEIFQRQESNKNRTKLNYSDEEIEQDIEKEERMRERRTTGKRKDERSRNSKSLTFDRKSRGRGREIDR